MIVEKILQKLNLNPNLVLAKAIRGYDGFTVEQLITALVYTSNVTEASQLLGYSSNQSVKLAIRKTLLPLFPERSKNFSEGGKIAEWSFTLLKLIEHKKCCTCNRILPYSSFGSHVGNDSTGLAGQCLSCRTHISKLQKLDIKNRTPSWANLDKIREFYNNCPDGFEVDHVIPLRGQIVSGLHVETNLQYLWASDNRSKSNKFSVLSSTVE